MVSYVCVARKTYPKGTHEMSMLRKDLAAAMSILKFPFLEFMCG